MLFTRTHAVQEEILMSYFSDIQRRQISSH